VVATSFLLAMTDERLPAGMLGGLRVCRDPDFHQDDSCGEATFSGCWGLLAGAFEVAEVVGVFAAEGERDPEINSG
jgi:hypothetical protein